MKTNRGAHEGVLGEGLAQTSFIQAGASVEADA